MGSEDWIRGSLLVLCMVGFSLVSSYLIRFSHDLFLIWNRLFSIVRPEREISTNNSCNTADYDIVFAGFHRIGWAVVKVIETNRPDLLKKIHVIDFNPVTLSELKRKGVFCTFGDIASYDTLEHAHISHAKVVISSIPDVLLKGTNNRTLVKMLRGIAPDASIIATADDECHTAQLIEDGCDMTLAPHELTATWLMPVLDEAMQNETLRHPVLQNA
jgi:hypothetical protein